MALTCGIQALDDNNRKVWSAPGLDSARQQLQNRRCLRDDVTALQNRHAHVVMRACERESRDAHDHSHTHATTSHLALIGEKIE